jgi:membrane protease YdiL (CAAX protease family)
MSTVDQEPSLPKAGPWGFWPTLGFSCIIGAAYVFVQAIVVAVFFAAAMLKNRNLDIDLFAEGLLKNGFFFAIGACVAAPLETGLTILFARIRRGIMLREYLALQMVGWKEIVKWCLIALVFVAFFDGLTYLIKRPIVPEFMVSTYETAGFVPLLWFAIVVVAPVSEEIFFRGFLFAGIRASVLGSAGAVILTSLAWAALHTQYDAYGMGMIFAGGLLLGLARLKSNSIYPAIAMHALQNVIATAEVVVYLATRSNGV